ncbi:MAG: zinc-ribbon domain-containing protein [Acidobacteriota bacterium]
MRCPSCLKEFRVSAGQIPSDGANVRCTACRTTFSVDASGEALDSDRDDLFELPATALVEASGEDVFGVRDARPDTAAAPSQVAISAPPPRRRGFLSWLGGLFRGS